MYLLNEHITIVTLQQLLSVFKIISQNRTVITYTLSMRSIILHFPIPIKSSKLIYKLMNGELLSSRNSNTA